MKHDKKNFEEWDNTWNLVSPAPSDQPPPANRNQHGLWSSCAEVSTELIELLNPDFVHVTRVVSGTRFRYRNDRYAEVYGR